MLARTPAPWTSSSGDFVGAFAPRTSMTLHATPSAVMTGTTRAPRENPGQRKLGLSYSGVIAGFVSLERRL
jgi:hypothetical protein